MPTKIIGNVFSPLRRPIAWALTETTPPANEPVKLSELKAQARILDDDTEDDVIRGMGIGARELLESNMRRSFINTSWKYELDAFPVVIRPPRSRLQSITSIKYIDTDDVQQTLTNVTDYRVDSSSEPGRITEAINTSWPTVQSITFPIEVVFVAGYGASPDDVPETIKIAIKMLAAHWFENREAYTLEGTPKEIPKAVRAIISSRIVPTVV